MGKYDNKHFLVNNWEESRKLQQILINDGYEGVDKAPYEYTKQYPHFISADEEGIGWNPGHGEDYYLDIGSVLTPLPWITEKYYKKYFKVECKEDLSRLQQYLFDAGYTTSNNKTDLCDWGDDYPIFIGTDYVASGRFGWAEFESFYSDQEEYEFMELPWKSEEKSYTEIEDSVVNEPFIVKGSSNVYIDQAKLEAVMPLAKITVLQWTDKHYNFNVDVSDKDTLKVDPYFVSKTWKIGSKDESGALFHILKTISRFGSKNTREREIKAIYKQIVRLAELEGVTLTD